jgi:hypothetical protein
MPKPKSKRWPPAETGSSQERTVLIEHEQLDAYSIALFCARHGISERFYFKLKAAGRGPAEMQLGNRVLISREAAAHWRAEREAESARVL